MQRRSWLIVAVITAIAAGGLLWARGGTRPLPPERLERKLASQSCRRIAECEPTRWDETYRRSFDLCIEGVQREIRPLLHACSEGRSCIRAVREAPCGAPWSAERIATLCPELDCE